MQKLLVTALALALFTGYTALVVVQHGPLGFLDAHAAGGWSVQIITDLVLAVASFLVLAVPDAKRLGITAWPYVIACFALGSIGVLAYLVHRQLRLVQRPERIQDPRAQPTG